MTTAALRHRNYAVALGAAAFSATCIVYCWYGPVVLDLDEVPFIASLIGSVALVISGAASLVHYANRARWFSRDSPWWHASLASVVVAGMGATLGFGAGEWFHSQLGLGNDALSWAIFLSVPSIAVVAQGLWMTRWGRALAR